MQPPAKTLVINTVGEPGSGKTTLSFWLSQALKRSGISTEFIPEIVKYECYDPQGTARVRSGRYDMRYLRQQARLLLPVLGQVEVVINDGAFELSYFYASRRMTPEALTAFGGRVDHFRAIVSQKSEAWFVMPERDHPYETTGRNESETEAAQIREQMKALLLAHYASPVQEVRGEGDRVLILERILQWVQRQRQAG